jgi:putative drug exporter of the RND superfamily
MFAIAFGLSMDYEVFLLTRVREMWARTHGNHTATGGHVADAKQSSVARGDAVTA